MVTVQFIRERMEMLNLRLEITGCRCCPSVLADHALLLGPVRPYRLCCPQAPGVPGRLCRPWDLEALEVLVALGCPLNPVAPAALPDRLALQGRYLQDRPSDHVHP